MKKIIGLLRLTRIVNSSMMGFATIIGAIIALKGTLPLPIEVSLGFITAFTLTGASMVVNDYYDRLVDAVNEPDRPIPSGTISTRDALLYAATLVVIGLSVAFITSLPCLLVATLSLTMSTAYNTKGKALGLIGNLMVSFCVAIPFIYGGLTVRSTVEPLLLLFSSMAFLSNTGREVTKGIVDVEGDRIRSLRTVALVHGPKKAAMLAMAFYVSAVLLSPIPLILKIVTLNYLILVVVSDIGFLVSSTLLLKDFSKENARTIKRAILFCMMMGLAAFVAGVFPAIVR